MENNHLALKGADQSQHQHELHQISQKASQNIICIVIIVNILESVQIHLIEEFPEERDLINHIAPKGACQN